MCLKQFLPILVWSAALPPLESAPRPLTDAHGDPLPPGAVARIGTVRLRHGNTVSSVAFSPDGKRLVSTDWQTVAVWDVRTGRTLGFRFLPPQYRCWPVVSPDGTLIACRLANGNLGIMETESGKERCSFPSKEGRVHQLTFSRDNRWLACNDDDGNVFLWDVSAKRSRRWTSPGKDPLHCRHAFTPDGKTLIHATKAGHIFLWDVTTGKELCHIEPDKKKEYHLNGLAVSPDGQVLATLNNWWRIELWQVKTGKFLHEIKAYGSWCGPIFSPGGKELLCGTREGEVLFWDVGTGKPSRQLRGDRKGEAASLAFSPDGKLLAAGGHDHAVHLWDLAARKELFPVRDPGGNVSACFLADGQTLLGHCSYWANVSSGTVNPQLGFWDLQGRSLKRATFDPKDAYAFAVAPDGKSVALADGFPFMRYHRVWKNSELRSSLRLCDLASGKEFQQIKDLRCEIDDLSFSPNGRFLFARVDNPGPNGEGYGRLPVVQVWKRSPGNSLKKIAELPCSGSTFICAPDSSWIGVPSEGVWNCYRCETGKLFCRCPRLPGAVRAVSPSGRVLACASDEERTASLVEFASGKLICKLECQPRYLVRPKFAFSPDGKIVAGDLNSAEIVLWDAFTGKQLGKLRGHRGDICSLCFSSDGRYLVSGSADTTILIWDYRKRLSR
jgi:WD40 repeat protein